MGAGPDTSWEALAGSLGQIFVTISLGAIFGRLNIIDPEARKPIGTFLSYVCLPALVFRGISNVNLFEIDGSFLASIAAAKSVLFLVVLFVTVITSRSTSRIADAGVNTMFATQSNDLALGLPLFTALYDDNLSRYMYLLAPLQLAVLNPISIIMMSFGKDRAEAKCLELGKMLLRVLLHPVVLSALLGVVVSVTAPNSLPSFIDSTLQLLGSSFSCTSLFILGLGCSPVNASSNVSLLRCAMLVMAKTIVAAVLCRFFAYMICGCEQWADVGFIYGLLPTAPTVYVFALQFDIRPQEISAAMLGCLFMSAPTMFLSGFVLNLNVDPDSFTDISLDVMYTTGWMGFLGALWIVIAFLLVRQQRVFPTAMLLPLALCQMLLPTMSYFCSTDAISDSVFFFYLVGVVGSSVWPTLMAFNSFLVHYSCKQGRVLPIGLKLLIRYHIVAWLYTGLITASLMVFAPTDPTLTKGPYACVFYKENVQLWVCQVNLILMTVLSVVFLILAHRLHWRMHLEIPDGDSEGSERDVLIQPVDELVSFRKLSEASYRDERRTEIFVIVLVFAMIVRTIGVGMHMISPPVGDPNSLSDELQLIDLALLMGQGLVTFIVFGLHSSIRQCYNNLLKRAMAILAFTFLSDGRVF